MVIYGLQQQVVCKPIGNVGQLLVAYATITLGLLLEYSGQFVR